VPQIRQTTSRGMVISHISRTGASSIELDSTVSHLTGVNDLAAETENAADVVTRMRHYLMSYAIANPNLCPKQSVTMLSKTD